MPTTPVDTASLKSHPVLIAGALRMMARHVGTGWDLATAHPTRLIEGADEIDGLVADARQITGLDQHDHELYAISAALRDAADARTR